MISEDEVRTDLERECRVGGADRITLTHRPTGIRVSGTTGPGLPQLLLKKELMTELGRKVAEHENRNADGLQ